MRAKENLFVKNDSSIPLFLSFGILILIALLSSRFYFRIDLTQNKLFSLSQYTKETLTKLDSEMKVTWYRSSDLIKYSPSFRTIEDYLCEYHDNSSNLLVVRIIDPVAMNVIEKISSLGLVPREIETNQMGGNGKKNIFSGILIEYEGQSRSIPFVLNTETLEYDLTRLIVELEESAQSDAHQNILQLLYGRLTTPDEYKYINPWITYAGFSQQNKNVPLDYLDIAYPLVVIGSSDLDSNSITVIQNFLSAGGDAVFYISGNLIKTAGDWSATPKKEDLLINLLKKYDISIESPLLLDTSSYRMTMPSLDDTKSEDIQYPFWITAQKTNMNRHSMLFSGVTSLQFYWPSEIKISKVHSNQVQGLVSTTDSLIRMDLPYNTNPFGNQISLFTTQPSASSAFLVASNTEKGRILVICDEYMPSSLIEYSNSDSNLDFFVNSIEWISGKDQLLSLKKKKKYDIQ